MRHGFVLRDQTGIHVLLKRGCGASQPGVFEELGQAGQGPLLIHLEERAMLSVP